MSSRLFETDVLYFQRLASCAGFYGGKLDGLWGPRTDAAARAWDLAFAGARSALGELDGRTEGNLYTLLPVAQVLMRKLLMAVRKDGIDARVVSGTRSYAEQNAIFRQGRFGNPGKVVTKARAGQSNHQFGIAIDIGIFEGGKYLDGDSAAELVPYKRAGELSKGVTRLEWGGRWPKPDWPHYQVETGLSISAVRERFEAGQPFVPNLTDLTRE